MKEKREKKKKHRKKHSKKKKTYSDSPSSSSESDAWVEKNTTSSKPPSAHDDWMSMTGILKTYSKDDIKDKNKDKNKQHIDSYNPSTSGRELNPYWKDGGSGLPESYGDHKKSRQFIKPSDEDDFYNTSNRSKEKITRNIHKSFANDRDLGDNFRKSNNWRKEDNIKNPKEDMRLHGESAGSVSKQKFDEDHESNVATINHKNNDSLYLSDEKMNKLAAKIVKAEITGDTDLVNKLKQKLEAAREYRKQNPDACNEDNDEKVMLMTTTASGSSRPLIKAESLNAGDPCSKGGKRKAETYNSNERVKYFANDDRYNLSQMFEQEKYGTNYDQDAELASIASKHKNPNDDLEDIFVDEISKNKSLAKEKERERQHAIAKSKKLERSLDGCEYCIDSKNMLKHLMVSCGNRVYMALPSRKSLVEGHCIITTIQHSTCVTSLDEDIWEEILNYRKIITQFFNMQSKDVVFYETATKLHRYPHMVINCVPLPRDVGDMASIYFKKALLECEAEWSMNKKVVELKGKDIRKGVPKALPYFWIDFGMDPGFAHVIEDQQLFPLTFAEEIIAGMLDLSHKVWKNPQREYGDVQRKKVLEFVKKWKPFEEDMKNKV